MDPAHFFSSDAFLGVVADVHFPGARPRVVACEDVVARVLVHRGKPISFFWNYPFYIPQISAANIPAVEMRVPYLKNVVRQVAPASSQVPGGMAPAFFIRWEDFRTWEEYEQFATTNLGMRSTSRVRDEARLARKFGPIRFVPDDQDPAAFQKALEWKGKQYQQSSPNFRYYIENNTPLYQAMRDRGLLMISSLRAGDRIVAVQFSNHWGRAFLYRLTAYDAEFRAYSPGVIHLHYLLKYSYEAGDNEFDFNFGRERYKYHYATHARWLSQVGTVPRTQEWTRLARMYAGRTAGRYPAFYRCLRATEAASSRIRWRLRLR